MTDLPRAGPTTHESGRVTVPLGLLRRLDCVLGPTKPAVLARAASLEGENARNAGTPAA